MELWRGHWGVTSGQSSPHCKHWKIALWLMSVAFACRIGSCLQLYLVDLTLAWSFYSQPLIYPLDAPGWRVWYCDLADSNWGTCLALHFRVGDLGAFLFLSCLKLPPPSHPTIASQGFHNPPLSTFATSSSGVTSLSTEKPATFQNLAVDDFILSLYAPWGGLFITEWHRSWFTRDTPAWCLLFYVITDSAPFYF